MSMFQKSVLKNFTKQELKSRKHKTEKEINAMVYELYELTDEEIKIVKGN